MFLSLRNGLRGSDLQNPTLRLHKLGRNKSSRCVLFFCIAPSAKQYILRKLTGGFQIKTNFIYVDLHYFEAILSLSLTTTQATNIYILLYLCISWLKKRS